MFLVVNVLLHCCLRATNAVLFPQMLKNRINAMCFNERHQLPIFVFLWQTPDHQISCTMVIAIHRVTTIARKYLGCTYFFGASTVSACLCRIGFAHYDHTSMLGCRIVDQAIAKLKFINSKSLSRFLTVFFDMTRLGVFQPFLKLWILE